MTNQQFCYWLQGYFELRETEAVLTEQQRESVSRHIEVCEKSMKNDGGLGPAVLAIRALLRCAGDGATPVIIEILSDVFEHVIDPAAGGPDVQAKLNHLHHGPPGPKKPVMRC